MQKTRTKLKEVIAEVQQHVGHLKTEKKLFQAQKFERTIKVLNQCLTRLGEPKKVKNNGPAPKDLFIKTVAQPKQIENDAPELFKAPAPKVEADPADAPKLPNRIKQSRPKFKGSRLGKNRTQAIEALKAEGKSLQEISQELWIDEGRLKKYFGIKTKGVVIADNAKDDLDDFIDEVKAKQ